MNKMIILLFCLLFSTSAIAAFVEPLDEIAAVVEDDLIMRTELEKTLKSYIKLIEKSDKPKPPKALLIKKALEQLISNKLQILTAKRIGINVSEDEVAMALSNIAKENKSSIGQLKKKLAKEGMTLADFRKNLKEELIKRDLMGKMVFSRIHVSDAEIENRLLKYKNETSNLKYHLQHILIEADEFDAEEKKQKAKKLAQDIIEKLKKGADFVALSKKYSQARNANKGGDLGVKTLADIPTIFSQIVPLMKEGEIKGPIKANSGYYILKLTQILGKKANQKQMIEQMNARHILIKTNEITSDATARSRLLQLKQRIEGGDDFHVLARANSDDKESAIKGGELGWISEADVTSDFAAQLKKLSEGEISMPFSTELGWHIVQLNKKRIFDNSENYLKELARKQIRAKKFAEARENFIRQLHDEAYIETRL